ncbi:coiled-coil domain-containing protein 152 [Tiliqua scincoides]|uniref:coiled-coil domain-containing protein 152 n=1 Tax=Tiliqua scincoides TaxID=71010 RepID=UPI00346292F5
MKKVSAVNLGKLLEDFSQIEKKMSELHGSNNLLRLQLEKANRLLAISQSKEESAKKECATLQNMIKSLQQTIESQCNLRDENEKLKKIAQTLEQTLKANEQEYNNQIDGLLREAESKKEEHKLEQRKIYCNMSRKIETKEEEHKQLIEKKDLEILELMTQLRAQEKDKQNEIIKLQIEFSAKLARNQNKSPKPYPDPSALPSNIYRRKLQHFQDEKNKEIQVLRNTIRDLEQRLSGRQDFYLKRRQF